jgi:hypothetical protein
MLIRTSQRLVVDICREGVVTSTTRCRGCGQEDVYMEVSMQSFWGQLPHVPLEGGGAQGAPLYSTP